MILWLLPVFKQLRGGFFLYFAIIALCDPVGKFNVYVLKLHPVYTHLFVGLLISITILYHCRFLNYKYLTGLIILFLITYFSLHKLELIYPIIGLRFLVLVTVLTYLIKEISRKQVVNVYFLVILLYELTIVLKFTALAFSYYPGIYYFYITTAFDLLPCTYFIFYNSHNSPVIVLASQENTSAA